MELVGTVTKSRLRHASPEAGLKELKKMPEKGSQVACLARAVWGSAGADDARQFPLNRSAVDLHLEVRNAKMALYKQNVLARALRQDRHAIMKMLPIPQLITHA
jgi:hypothetical protein